MNTVAKIVFAITICVGAALPALSDVPQGYYDTADDSTPVSLRSTLNVIITAGHVGVPFNAGSQGGSVPSYNALRRVDRDHGDSEYVRLLYTGDPRLIDPHDPTNDSNPATGGWNREHCFPQSFFNSDEPMVGDLHALFPADVDINSTRSNKAYDVVPSPTYTDVFGNKSSTGLFEPQDSMKGNAARAIFYMDIRYEGESGEPDLTIGAATAGTGGNTMAVLNTLLQWHNDDPPDVFEGQRNHRVYDEQGNANPFVDHPEWVSTIYGSSMPSVSDSDTVSVTSNDLAQTFIEQDVNDAPFISLTLTLASNEYDVGEVDVSMSGILADSDVDAISLYHDADSNGVVSLGDVLIDSRTLSGNQATFAPTVPFRLTLGSHALLVAATLTPSAAVGATVQIHVDALRNHYRGGDDVDPSFSTQSSGVSIVKDGGVNIVMVSTRGSSGAASEEYVVLANQSANPVNIDGWELRSRGATGTNENTTSLSGTIPANGHFIIADDSYSINDVEGEVADLLVTSIVGGMADDTRRSIGLYSSGGINAPKVDGFSWNGGADFSGSLNDGAPFDGVISTSTQARRNVYSRKRTDVSTGPYVDTDNNITDLEVLELASTTGDPKPPPTDSLVRTSQSSLIDGWMMH